MSTPENKELKEWNNNLEKTAVNQYIEIQELKKANKELEKTNKLQFKALQALNDELIARICPHDCTNTTLNHKHKT